MADGRSRFLGGGMATWTHTVYVCDWSSGYGAEMRFRDGSVSSVEAENHDKMGWDGMFLCARQVTSILPVPPQYQSSILQSRASDPKKAGTPR